MKWSPNPYAIAQLLSGELDDGHLHKTSGRDADNFLRQALLRNDVRTIDQAFARFRQLAATLDQPDVLAEKIKQPLVAEVARLYGDEPVQRALYYLLPITDAIFARAAGSGSVNAIDAWYADANQLLQSDASFLDPVQGYVGDCYLISAMIALAWTKSDALAARLRGAGFAPPEQRTFAWQFHNDEGAERGRKTVSGRIPVTGQMPRYARSASAGESWPSLIEKAYVVQVHPPTSDSGEPSPADYQSIDRKTTPPLACQSLAGGEIGGETLNTPRGEEVFAEHNQFGEPGPLHTASGVMSKPVMAWTRDDIGGDSQLWEQTGLWPGHAYAVLGVMSTGHIVLRNPHGIATQEREGYARGTWNADRQSVELNKNGVFAISRALFFKNFGDIGWVDLE